MAPMAQCNRTARRAIVFLLGLVLLACGEENSRRASTAPIDRNPPPAAEPASSWRIVSFSPALSRIAADLGLEESIVGRTPWSPFLSPSIPIVGDLRSIDYEMLVRLEPRRILVQPPADGVDPALLRLAEERGWTIASWRINTIQDILRVIDEMPAKLAGAEGPPEPLRDRARRLLEEIEHSLRPLPSETQEGLGPVLVALPGDPPLAFGRGTYLHDVLTRLGAENATPLDGWVKLTLEDVTRLDPWAIVLLAEHAPADADPATVAGPIAELPIGAARERRIAILRHPDAVLPASTVSEVAEELRSILSELAGAGPSAEGSS